MTPCLDDNFLSALADGQLDAAALEEAEEHMDQCAECAELAAAFGQVALSADAAGLFLGGEAVPGDRLGRYRITGWLGRGAMGQVYTAVDPSLDREVALKLVSSRGNQHLEERLAREAKAMAQLSDHTNVVAVYDVGSAAGRTFIAMELVRGSSLENRLAQKTLSWREILALFLPAGRGLAAAHGAGIVHRDFKPGNVLIGDDDRVKVGDFGLATEDALGSRGIWPKATTAAGTPAYMSPEQHRGEIAEAASDQFSFAVSLWEALVGERPFPGRTAAEIRAAVIAGERREPPRSRVPGELLRCIETALSVDPSDRYPSMGAFLDRLEQAGKSRKKRYLAAGATAVVAAGVLGFMASTDSSTCPQASARLHAVWSPELRARLGATLESAPRSYAAALSKSTLAALDDYGADWLDVRQNVCRATHVRGEQSGELLDSRMRCLDQKLSELGSLATLLASDPELIDRSLLAVRALPDAELCARSERDSTALVTLGPEARFGSEARALLLAGQYRKALERAQEGLDALGEQWPRERARLHLTRGLAHSDLFESKPAEEALILAGRLAAQSGDAHGVASAWSMLVYVVGVQQGRHDAGMVWADATERELERAPDPRVRQHLLRFKAGIFDGMGDMEKAGEYFARALELAEGYADEDPLAYATALYHQANFWRVEGRLGDAQSLLEKVVSFREKELGSEHPSTASARLQLGRVLRKQGEAATALGVFEAAIANLEAILGPENSQVASARGFLAETLLDLGRIADAQAAMELARSFLDDEEADLRDRAQFAMVLGKVLQAQQRFQEAAQAFRRARTLWAEQTGLEEHHQIASLGVYLGTVLQQAGELDEADQELTGSLDILEKIEGTSSPNLAPVLHNLAEVKLRRKDCAGAIPLLERTAMLIETSAGPNHFNMTFPLVSLATCDLERGDHVGSIARLERALAIREGSGRGPEAAEEVRFLMARARWAAGQRSAARKLAEQALTGLRDVEGAEPMRREVRSWLSNPASHDAR